MQSNLYKKAIISGFHNINYTYTGIAFSPLIIKAGEDIKKQGTRGVNEEYIKNNAQTIAVSFLPTSRKTGLGITPWIKYNDNQNYSTYAYGQDVRLVIRAFARDVSGVKGSDICDDFLNKIEEYLKIQAYSILSGISVDRNSFIPSREVYTSYSPKVYGYELQCDITVTNQWTNEPASGARSCYPITGVNMTISGYQPMIWI